MCGRGGNPNGEPQTAKVEATVVAGDSPEPEPTPAPTVTGGHSAGHAAEDQLIHGGAAYVLEGENLSGASVKLAYGEMSVDVPASQVTVTPGTVTVAWEAIRPALDAAAETVTFTVTTPGGTATYVGDSSNE